MITEKDTKNHIQDKELPSSDKDKIIGRRNIFSLFLGGISSVAVATILKSKAAHATLSPKVSNENILKSKDPETYSLIDAIDDHLRVIAHNTDVWENARKNFFKEMTQLTDYVSNFVTENSDLAKMRPKKYSKALTSKINSITPTYDNYNNIYEVWKKLVRTNKQLSPQEKLFVAGANQHLKGTYHEIKAFVFKEIFHDIQTKVTEDKKSGKIPEDINESDAIFALSKQLSVQIQISQYAATTEILNSINMLVLSKNPSAFHIPENMKLPKLEDFKKVLDAAISGQKYPENFK
ncbi:MAG: hypothetical protein DCC88_02960 [Spirobacillus cienkowskii]|jgi:hypothetical protein|uniref:Uncharacterized protein n=1 Tax=Spirobacillus cienkowskii TaxID=495820 RepID=A0A369KSY3_9BACT|nr:MAG: hypothetical protein DCC88_02960 [Spirobacillus cienkowskii]